MDISTILSNNKIIIFAGSGLSKNLHLPDWNEMVIDIIKEINNVDFNHFIPLFEKKIMSPIDVLELIKNNRNEVYTYIKSTFNLQSTSKVDFQKKLLKLSNNKVITTNYDNSFEIASGNTIIASKPTSKYSINEADKNDNPFIFKLHGSFDEPDNCIIFKEDYEKLYELNNNQAAPEKLKSLFANSTFLFVGFGFNDPDIDLIFDKMNKTFGGLNKHFIITPEPGKFEKYSFLEPLIIIDYNSLEAKIDELLAIKEKENETELQLTNSLQLIKARKKITILYPEILNQHFAVEYKNTIALFEEVDADLLIGSLNLKTLQLVDDSDLLIIISNVYKEKIYIEEDNLKSNLLDLEDTLDNLPNSEIPVLILTNEKLNKIDIPYSVINIHNYKNQTIKRFLHKIIKDKCFSFSEESITSNLNSWFIELEKGKASLNNFYGNDRNLEIGKKCLTNIIGRIEEQSNLISRFLMINTSNKILNIKASGGLGKTTICKKIAYELYNRGYYKKGVNFKSCENVKNYDDFEALVYEGFNLAEILNFREHLVENYSNEKIDLLLLLDNFETVVNNLSEEDYSKAINLLEFISDYSNVVITSREVISNREFEEVFTLTPMTTDDALELFKLNYKGKNRYSNDEIKILRVDILEDLLANNPLAIKLVTTSRPEMQIDQLRDQIRNHFFESINEEYSDVFKNNADLNIERSKSIFQSINYSYSFLNHRQKLSFELLSLFPDGIILNDFKHCFRKSKSSNNITDTEIKQLENKSLLENYNGRLQLQPIIRRFADYQFAKHSDNMQKYCVDAYAYNCYIMNTLNDVRRKSSYSFALHIFSSLKNNLLKVLEYIPNIKIEEGEIVGEKKFFLNYIHNLEGFLTNTKNIEYFENKTKALITYFDDVVNARNLIEVIIHKANYYQNEFDYSYSEMSKLLSVKDMENRNFSDEEDLEKRWKFSISIIHSMEGFTLNFINCMIKNGDYSRDLSAHYYYLGLEEIRHKKDYEAFYYFENLLRNSKLDVNELKSYIDSLYMEQHLQIMQCSYILSKVEPIPAKSIHKLVISNPYTKGLKNLMLAFSTNDEKEKIIFFEKALQNLKHIKYYYLEAVYYYAKYLKDINSEKYETLVLKGFTASQKYKYKYLDHLFSDLLNNTREEYELNYEYYKTEGLEEYVHKDNKEWERTKV